ncbi:MAG TPA: hypothetical protein VKB86_12700 [Pyrinomonadaceae bacterium]|nr:hypothetical protein [Pyrinomonadaceae bacterium]
MGLCHAHDLVGHAVGLLLVLVAGRADLKLGLERLVMWLFLTAWTAAAADAGGSFALDDRTIDARNKLDIALDYRNGTSRRLMLFVRSAV